MTARVQDSAVRAGAHDCEVAFTVLTDDQVALLRPRGQTRPTRAGEVLFRAGDSAYDLIVILAGRLRDRGG